MNRFATNCLALACFSLMTASPAHSERPSINALNAAVNQLQAEVNQLQAENDAQQAQLDALAPGALRVFDANGSDLGFAVGNANLVLLESPEAFVTIDHTDGSLQEPTRDVYFEEAGCQGTAFVTATQLDIHHVFGNGPETSRRHFISNAEPA